jgi:hypothetical protein
LTARLEKTILSEKMIEEYFSRVECAIKSTYRLGVGFERCEDKSDKSAPKFIPSSTCHKEKETIKSTKTHYPFNPKPSFNPKRSVKKETLKPREEVFIYMFCGRAGHLDEFCFWCKRIEKMRFKYVRNSYHDEFFDLPPHSYSRVLPHFYSRAMSHTFSCALSHLSHGPNHHSYGFGSRENCFEPRHFGYGPSFPRHGDYFLRRPGILAGASHTHFEPRHLDNPNFSRRGSRPTRPNGEVERTMKTSSGHMVKC